MEEVLRDIAEAIVGATESSGDAPMLKQGRVSVINPDQSVNVEIDSGTINSVVFLNFMPRINDSVWLAHIGSGRYLGLGVQYGTANGPAPSPIRDYPGKLEPATGIIWGRDQSGNVRHATQASMALGLTPDLGYWANTWSGFFNGTTAELSVPHVSAFDQSDNGIILIIRPTTVTGTHRIVSKTNNADTTMNFEIRQNGNQLEYRYHNGSGVQTVNWAGMLTINQFDVFEFYKSGTTHKLYKNGVLVSQQSSTGGTATANTDPMKIGSGRVTPTEFFQGDIACVAILDTPTSSDADALLNYNAAASGASALLGQLKSTNTVVFFSTVCDIPPNRLLAYGQAVSRVTYADLFSYYGTLYGAGDGSTTFNIIDMRAKTFFGLDNMGGADAALLSVANTLGLTGGEELHLLTGAESGTSAHPHGHSLTGTIGTLAISDTHYHQQKATNHDVAPGSGTQLLGMTFTGGNNLYSTQQYTATKTGTISITGAPGVTGSISNSVAANASSAHNNMPPYVLGNWLIAY
jgi:microcystin-dependent protein